MIARRYADGSFGAHLDFYTLPLFGRRLLQQHNDVARSKSFMLRVGYLFSRTPSGSTDPFTEHTPTVETHWRFPLPGSMLLTDRNRVDFRLVDGDYQPRYRNRLKLERTFKAGRVDLTPYGHAEAFYDWRFDKFHRFRYAAGAEVSLGRHLVFESYYLRQNDTVSSPQYVNAVGEPCSSISPEGGAESTPGQDHQQKRDGKNQRFATKFATTTTQKEVLPPSTVGSLVETPVHGEFVIMPPWASEIIRDNVLSIDMTSTSRTH